MNRCQIVSWFHWELQNLMEWAKFVAYKQNAIVSLNKNLLWNDHHCSLVILFCKNVLANQMSFLFIEFNFCPKNKASQIVKITLLAFTCIYEDRKKSISSFLKKNKTSLFYLAPYIYCISWHCLTLSSKENRHKYLKAK